jgi:hypothetical protein
MGDLFSKIIRMIIVLTAALKSYALHPRLETIGSLQSSLQQKKARVGRFLELQRLQ